MSKYDPLWRAVSQNGSPRFSLTFDDIQTVLGFPIDHSFLNFKKELLDYGYRVGKISLKQHVVWFEADAPCDCDGQASHSKEEKP